MAGTRTLHCASFPEGCSIRDDLAAHGRKLGMLQRIGTTWTLIGVAILIGIGIMVSVSHSGSKENIQIDRK